MFPDNTALSASSSSRAVIYWEDRAQRYAQNGDGLAAVCSYGMPAFYNHAIQLCQRLALKRWIGETAGLQVLDVGSGVGRWSCWMAAQGARVTGVDLSPTMVAEASRRAAKVGVADRCRFLAQDLADLNTGSRYQLVLGVTVLQHILEVDRLQTALCRLAAHLAPGGRLVLLEAAPTRAVSRCDHAFFKARDLSSYLRLFAECGLTAEAITGVDPMSLKTIFLPYYRRLPKPLAILGLSAVMAVSLPVDLLFGRRWISGSWHKVFVLKHHPGSTDVACGA